VPYPVRDEVIAPSPPRPFLRGLGGRVRNLVRRTFALGQARAPLGFRQRHPCRGARLIEAKRPGREVADDLEIRRYVAVTKAAACHPVVTLRRQMSGFAPPKLHIALAVPLLLGACAHQPEPAPVIQIERQKLVIPESYLTCPPKPAPPRPKARLRSELAERIYKAMQEHPPAPMPWRIAP
jgi:hypothetical protein